MHYRSRGAVRMPIVIRIPFGGGIGAVEHHSESPEAYFVHTAGLKVVSCATPEDAYWMIQRSNESDAGSLHESRIVRSGSDATVVAYGQMVRTALDAAPAADEDGRSLEVID